MTRCALWCTAIDDHAANLPHRACSRPSSVWNKRVVPRPRRDEIHKPKGGGQKGCSKTTLNHVRSICATAAALPRLQLPHKQTSSTKVPSSHATRKSFSTRYPYSHNSQRAPVAPSHSQIGAPAEPHDLETHTNLHPHYSRHTPASQPRPRRLPPAAAQ
jgi:hypothetical protein